MKKIMLIMSFLACMFLTACHGTVSEKSADSEPELQGISEVVLYEEQGIVITLKAVNSIESERKVYMLNVANETEQERSITLENIVFNDIYVVSEYEVFYLDPLEEADASMDEMAEIAYREELKGMDMFQCHFILKDENYDILDEKDLTVHMEEKLVHSVDYDTCMGAKAGEQLLFEDDRVKLTLIELGKSTDNYYITAIACMENKSEDTIPAMVSGMAINGIYFKGADSVNFLEPGHKCYSTYSISLSELEDEGIASITEVELMILTDESQNTGSVSYAGGEWYPIELEEKGDAGKAFEEGELLEVMEDVRISYVGQEGNEWSSGGGYYEWKLAVVNDSDENIKISIIDVLVDGIPEEQWQEDSTDYPIYMAETELGAHSSRYVHINMSCYEEMLPRPELSFRFQIRSMAGGAVISTGEELITITPDKE